jgi:hypothetical protein
VEGVHGGVRSYLSVRDLAGVVDDRVARLDRDLGRLNRTSGDGILLVVERVDPL